MRLLYSFIITSIFIGSSFSVWSQKDFRFTYDQFRYGLYEDLDSGQMSGPSNELGEKIRAFLKNNGKEIISFRVKQLEKYKRPAIEEAGTYTMIDQGKFEEIKAQVVMLGAQDVLSQSDTNKQDSQDMENVNALLGLLSVDPILLVKNVSSQAISLLFFESYEMEDLANMYGRMAIGGVYIATQPIGRTKWSLSFSNYYCILNFSIDSKSGEIELLSIKTRS